MNSKTNKTSHFEDGRKILYRLLLLAVAVVYALVFVLDYLLQLHFTFFLLLSFFGFVILLLFYMLFRVRKKEFAAAKQAESKSEEKKDISIKPSLVAESVFGDAVFIIDGLTGLTIDCNEAASNLFEAEKRDQLIGIDLTYLFDYSWKVEERSRVKEDLDKKGKADVQGFFKTISKKVFPGRLQAVRIKEGTTTNFNVRISPVEPEVKAEEQVSEEGRNDWFENAGFPMACIGLNYLFTMVNAAFCQLSGYNENELKRMSVLDLIHPEDKASEKRILSGLFRGEIGISKKEKRFLRRNNEVIWVKTSSSLSRDAHGYPRFIITMAENITHQKRIDHILSENKNKLVSLVENAEYSLLTVDRRHTILLINSKLSDLFFSQTGIVVETGFNFFDILPESFHKDYLDIHKRAFNGEQFVFEKTFTVFGKKSTIEIVVTPAREENGRIRSISIFGHDVSERRRNEDELIRAKQEAEAATQAKSGFLATMSHEIRTPLNGVIGMGRLLSKTKLTPKQQEFVDSILLSGDALLSVINDILDFSKIESSKMELEHKPIALKRCIEETFDLLAAKAIEKNLSLHYSVSRDVPAYIYGDITRLRQILMNLVSNAIKFTARGKITIGVSRTKTEGKKIELRFDIQDTGIGISPAKIKRLFRSFSQADPETAKTYGGTGLGLAICKNLVGLMGGKIWVESKEGEGSDFIFTIQTEVVSQDEIPKSQRNGTSKLANSYALIISDDKTEAGLYADYFKRWGMIPHVIEDVSKSVDEISRRKDYNLVMIDAQLISEKPLVLAEEIRNVRTKEELPVVLFNAVKTDDIFFDYTSEVVSAVIPKNVDRSKVLDILISVFSVEEHQRSRDEQAISEMSAKLSEEVPVRILVAEDNQINQKLAQNIFEGLGYKPVIVSNGLQVIDELKKENYDIIFMDVQMPEMDGFETTRFIIQKLQTLKKPVIIAMTAFALEGDKEKCIDAGMNDYISKPFMIEEIVEKIRKWAPGKNNGKNKSAQLNVRRTDDRKIININTLNRLKEMTGEADLTFFKKVIRMYIDQGDEQIIDIKDALSLSDIDRLGSIAHKLKGSSLNLGAEILAETCRAIELKAREKNLSGMDVLVNDLIKQFGLVKKELVAVIA